MRKILLFASLFAWSLIVLGQDNFPINDVKDNRTNAYAFTNATIHVDHQTTIENATLLIKEGIIQQVGSSISTPKGYTTIDAKGKHLYPSFIEMYLFVPSSDKAATSKNNTPSSLFILSLIPVFVYSS